MTVSPTPDSSGGRIEKVDAAAAAVRRFRRPRVMPG
jgi:hypothetical protein